MLIDFTKVSEDENTFELLNEGSHVLKVEKVEPKMSQKGTEYWLLTYVDKDGVKVFDNLFFTDKTLNRVKKLFHLLGLDVDGEFDYEPEELVGLYLKASVLIEEYSYNGKSGKKNVIDLWSSEAYQTKKPAPKKVTHNDVDEIPF